MPKTARKGEGVEPSNSLRLCTRHIFIDQLFIPFLRISLGDKGVMKRWGRYSKQLSYVMFPIRCGAIHITSGVRCSSIFIRQVNSVSIVRRQRLKKQPGLPPQRWKTSPPEGACKEGSRTRIRVPQGCAM